MGAPSRSSPDPVSLCPDINECLRFGTCSQLCNNTKGSHICSCAKNFMKTDNMCKAEGQEGAGTHTGSVHAQHPPCAPELLWESFTLPSKPLSSAHPSVPLLPSVRPWQSDPKAMTSSQ